MMGRRSAQHAGGAGGQGSREGARAWGQAVADLGAARSASASDGLTADLIDALRGISERLEKLEDDRHRAPAAAPSGGGKPDDAGDSAGTGIGDDLLAALRARRDAFANVVDQDRGVALRKAVDGSARDDSDAQLLADLQEAHRRVEKRAVDPSSVLKKQIIKAISTGVVKTRLLQRTLCGCTIRNEPSPITLRVSSTPVVCRNATVQRHFETRQHHRQPSPRRLCRLL